MERRETLVLAALAPAEGARHTPAQVQKLFFLIDRNIPDLIDGTVFNFQPYHYGPFDKDVYAALELLEAEQLVDIDRRDGAWRTYRLTVAGQQRGGEVFASLPQDAQVFIAHASEFVRSLGFSQLVAAIYRAYPEMREKSVFKEPEPA